jgi:hypothetical protein
MVCSFAYNLVHSVTHLANLVLQILGVFNKAAQGRLVLSV